MTPMDAMAALHDLRQQLRQRPSQEEAAPPGKVVRLKRRKGPDRAGP